MSLTINATSSFSPEGASVGFEKQVDTFSPDGAANEEELELFASRQRIGGGPGMKKIGVHPVRDHPDPLRRHPARHVGLENMLAWDPYFIDQIAHRPNPVFRQPSELPWLNHYPMARRRRSEVRRPLVTDVDIRHTRETTVDAGGDLVEPPGRLGPELVLLIRYLGDIVTCVDQLETNFPINQGEGMVNKLGAFPDYVQAFFRAGAALGGDRIISSR